MKNRSNTPERFFGKGVVRLRNKFTEEHLSKIMISVKLIAN